MNIFVVYWYFEDGILSNGGADAMLQWFSDVGNSADFRISINEFWISIIEISISVYELQISVNEFQISVNEAEF